MTNKVVIIGCGNVGMSYAYALLNQQTKVNDLVLIDIKKDKTQGEAMDLNHGLVFSPSKINIKVGDYEDCYNASIICICAGINQLPGESRLDLVNKNSVIFKDIINKVMVTGFKGIFLIATNPVDIMSYITYKYSKLDAFRVIGTGTTLDTVRLRYLIGNELKLSPKNVHAYVIGEHGDSEFVAWSNAFISSIKINRFLSKETLAEIALKVKNYAYEIIKKKGATFYAIGMVLVRITNAILDDENTILTISSYDKLKDVYYGRPAIVNKNGIGEIIDIELDENETKQLDNSISILQNEIKKWKEGKI